MSPKITNHTNIRKDYNTKLFTVYQLESFLDEDNAKMIDALIAEDQPKRSLSKID